MSERPVRRARRPVGQQPAEESQDAKSRTEEAAAAYDEAVDNLDDAEGPPEFNFKGGDFVCSTGSTLLDLAIFGGRFHGGGVPGGIVIEIYSEPGLGKTALAAELCGYAQREGGEVRFCDPEGRLDIEYSKAYGVNIPPNQYTRLHLVSEIEQDFLEWNPPNRNVPNVYVCDSLAALTTNMEMDKGDKMGMRRAKELSQLFRKAGVEMAHGHKIFVATNQLREGESGTFTPGGKAVGYWASVRVELRKINRFTKGTVNKNGEIAEVVKVGSKRREVTKTIGIRSMARIVKNSCDDPFRFAPVALVFGYGIDNIRENLQFLKDMEGTTTFVFPDGTSRQGMNDAIAYVEDNELEEEVQERTIQMWNNIQAQFKTKTGRRIKRR